MRRLEIKEGQRFGRLVVVEEVERVGRHRSMLAECDCGTVKTVRLSHLTGGQIVSCGCHLRDLRFKHGMYGKKIYRVWGTMIQRCTNPHDNGWGNYGGRGIKVCERWHDFQAFYEDMGSPPAARMEIDRINNDGNYEPGNCRWTTATIQKRNRRKRAAVSSKYRGVCWRKISSKWQAEIKVAGRRRFLGLFANEEDAARAYDAVARMYAGFQPNFPNNG